MSVFIICSYFSLYTLITKMFLKAAKNVKSMKLHYLSGTVFQVNCEMLLFFHLQKLQWVMMSFDKYLIKIA